MVRKALQCAVLLSLLLLPQPATGALEIVCSGWPDRQGNLQLQKALEILGYKVHDVTHIFGMMEWWPWNDVGQIAAWRGAYQDKPAINASFVKSVFTDKGYTVAGSWPAGIFWEELVELHPHIKIIHTERASTSAWWADAQNPFLVLTQKSIYRPTEWEWHKVPAMLISHFLSRDAYDHHRRHMSYMTGVENVVEQDGYPLNQKEVFAARYEENNAKVRALPRTMSIIHDHADGWPALCEFLGKPIPTEPYPIMSLWQFSQLWSVWIPRVIGGFFFCYICFFFCVGTLAFWVQRELHEMCSNWSPVISESTRRRGGRGGENSGRAEGSTAGTEAGLRKRVNGVRL